MSGAAISNLVGEAPAQDTPMYGQLPIGVRRVPYPYHAMLSICSDLDETPDGQLYFETLKFLNTTETTSMGPGAGLEVGDTIYFDMPSGQFSYWNTDDRGRHIVRTLIRSGHVDCLHSFGDLATTRAHAGRALDELNRHGCHLEVWIDHATAPTNFGGDIMRGQGDLRGSAAYHADLTCAFGVQYVWRGRVTSVVGQNSARSLSGVFTPRHPLASARTVAKEFAKGLLARQPGNRYAMHRDNRVLRRGMLRDGQRVFEFLRANPCWGGVSCNDTANGLAEVLTERLLQRLLERQGASILYTHLGKISNRSEPFGARTRAALRRLAEYARDGKLLVTTTRRLLGYCRTIQEMRCESRLDGNRTVLDVSVPFTSEVSGVSDDMSGLTFYVNEPHRVDIVVNGRSVSVRLNLPDSTGRASVSVPWRPLEFPRL